MANGLSSLSETLTDTTLQMIRNIPHLALIPLVILWFGIDEEAKVFLVALGVFFPIYVNTLHGVRSVDPQLLEMARAYGMTDATLFLPRCPAGRAAVDLRRPPLRARHHVADADRRRDDRGHLWHRLHGDATPASSCRSTSWFFSILLYAALGKLADSAGAGCWSAPRFAWNPAYAKA